MKNILTLILLSLVPLIIASAPASAGPIRVCRDAYVVAPSGWDYPCWALEAFAPGFPGAASGSSAGCQ